MARTNCFVVFQQLQVAVADKFFEGNAMDTSKDRQATTVNLTNFSLEDHVEQSFRTALILSEGQPINARHALQAALIVGRYLKRSSPPIDSPAFSYLSSLLPSTDLVPPNWEEVLKNTPTPSREEATFDLKAIPLGPSLGIAFSVAKPFLETEKGFWGRDYITLALLAADPSLTEIAEKAERNLISLRDEWFQFLISNEAHRGRESWEKWWHKAGVPLPEERIPKTPPKVTDKTYLLTWDPKRFAFSKVVDVARRIEQEGIAFMSWSIGREEKEVSIGDRVFFMRHGEDKPGLVGSGQIVSEAYEGAHWDKIKTQGGKVFYVNVLCYTFREFPLLPLARLVDITQEKDLWTKQGNGFDIPVEVLERLLPAWEKVLKDALALFVNNALQSNLLNDDVNNKTGFIERDCLGLTDYVNSFANLLVSEKIAPPISVGLFGDWGMGKSYFMNMIKERINELTCPENRETNSGYVCRVCQIEFNAWHYADTKLWACLAQKIFDDLAVCLLGDKAEKQESQLRAKKRELRSSISSSERIKEEAISQKEKFEDNLKDLKNKLEKQREEKRKQYFQSFIKNRATVVSSIKKIAKELNLQVGDDDFKSIDKFEELYKEVSEFKLNFKSIRGWFDWKKVMLLLLTTAGLYAVVDTIIPGFFPNLLTAAEKTYGKVGSLLAPAWTFLVSKFRKVNNLTKIVVDLKNKHSEFEESEVDSDEIKEINVNIQSFIDQIESENKKIADAENEIERIESGGLVYDFLSERTKDRKYLDELGLISTIREDFKQLGEKLLEWREDGKEPIKRIILYIDDLDRCEPERVVDVLQAVHLLLALDLFNVVVGVDARWLEKSLNKKYAPNSNEQKGSELSKDNGNVFDAQNYLEKIFQIPFSVPQMTPENFRYLVDDYITTDSEYKLQEKLRNIVEREIIDNVFQKELEAHINNEITYLNKDETVMIYEKIKKNILKDENGIQSISQTFFNAYKKEQRRKTKINLIEPVDHNKAVEYVDDKTIQKALIKSDSLKELSKYYNYLTEFIANRQKDNEESFDDINKGILTKYLLVKMLENPDHEVRINEDEIKLCWDNNVEDFIKETKFSRDKAENAKIDLTSQKKGKEEPKETTAQDGVSVQNSKKDKASELKKKPASPEGAIVPDEEEQESEEINLNLLSNNEQQYMGLFYNFIPSPRLVKQFTNIYKLIRFISSNSNNANDNKGITPFLENDGYKVVQTLLAMNVGFPTASGKLFRFIANEEYHNGNFMDFLNKIISYQDQKETRNQNKEMKTQLTDEETKDLKKIIESLNGIELVEDFRLYRSWVLDVGRYSYNWHLD